MIADFAEAIRSGSDDRAVELLMSGEDQLTWVRGRSDPAFGELWDSLVESAPPYGRTRARAGLARGSAGSARRDGGAVRPSARPRQRPAVGPGPRGFARRPVHRSALGRRVVSGSPDHDHPQRLQPRALQRRHRHGRRDRRSACGSRSTATASACSHSPSSASTRPSTP